MKESEDGAKTRTEQIKIKKVELRDTILLFYIKNKHAGIPKPGIKKREIKEAIEENYPELAEFMDYFEDAFEMLRAKKGEVTQYLKTVKGHSYGLNEEVSNNIIQDYRLASFLLKLAERFEEKSFSFAELKGKFPNNKYLENFLEELKKMGYISNDLVLKGEDCYLVVLDRYKQEKFLLELIIKEKIRKIR